MRRKRRAKRVEIPEEWRQELVRELRAYLTRLFSGKGVAVIYAAGASEPAENDAVARLHGHAACVAAWRIFGRGVRRKQVVAVVWGVMGIFAPRIRKQYGLPLRKREVTKWLWLLGQDD